MSPGRRHTSPAAAWAELQAGNARFVRGVSLGDASPERRAALSTGQEPHALVFGCSDSRVSAELVFDQGLGDLFVVRTAGHVADSGVLGSIEYGVAVLGIPLVIVLGHDSCGAVRSTLDVLAGGAMPEGYVRDVVERVTPSVLAARRRSGADASGRGSGVGGDGGDGGPVGPSCDEVVVEHVRQGVDQLARRSVVVAEAVASARCAVVGVVYALDDGEARVVEVLGELA